MTVDEAQTCDALGAFSQCCRLQDRPRGTCLLPVNLLGGQLCRWGRPPGSAPGGGRPCLCQREQKKACPLGREELPVQQWGRGQ